MKIQTEIQKALRGEKSEVLIYWDRQDSANVGPAYRTDGDTGSLECVGWAHTSGRPLNEAETVGYNISDYFRANDGYQGPDQDGIYPVLEII